MAFDPSLKMSIVDTASGQYYSAVQNPTNGTYTIQPLSTGVIYIDLPEAWSDITIDWDRDPDYLGVFRSNTSTNSLIYSGEARAILSYLRATYGLKADATLVLWIINTNDFNYSKIYTSQFDYTTYRDSLQTEQLQIATLDSQLFRLVKAYGNSSFNIKFWNSTDGGVTWTIDPAAIAAEHQGIKLLYQSAYTSSANPNLPTPITLDYLISNSQQLNGWNDGAIGDGYHIIPPLSTYNIVQNNGTTTFIGNDILEPFLITGIQNPGAANFGSEDSFAGINHSQPYTKNNYSLKSLLPNEAYGGTFKVDISIDVTFAGSTLGNIFYNFPSGSTNPYMQFVLFEIDQTNNPPIVSSRYTYLAGSEMGRINFPTSPNSGNIYVPGVSSTGVTVTLQYDRVYVLGIICDRDQLGSASSCQVSFQIAQLDFFIKSHYDSGVSGTPIPAPYFPPSPFLAYRPGDLLAKIASFLPTVSTDINGFPIPVSTDITAVSNFLNNASATPSYDAVPYNMAITSAYCMHDLSGQSYVTISLNDLFDFCKKIFQCGLSIEADVNGNQTVLRIENLGYYFNNSVMLFDLGQNVFGVEIEPFIDNMGANLKAGFTKASTNEDAGVDAFTTELYYDTPLSILPGVMDYEEGGVLCEMYAIEKIRAQQVSQPIGAGYDPANPSGDNQTIGIYLNPTFSSSVLIYDPSNNPHTLTRYLPQVYPTAQSTDNTAATAPYIHGLYYPDTAINIPCSPCRALRRSGGLLHSVFDTMDASSLTFRNTGVIQYNNQALPLASIESNLEVGAGANVITEFADIPISELDNQLFKPTLISFTTEQPINMWQIINNNPNGYIQFSLPGNYQSPKIYKGFIWKVSQTIGNRAAIKFTLLATPDMVI